MNASPLWDTSTPCPPAEDIPDLDVVTHVSTVRAQPGGWHYLHETALAWHQGRLHQVWATHPTYEANEIEESLRSSTSLDGLRWDEPGLVASPATHGGESWNHPVIWSHAGQLWGFFTRWQDHQPTTEIMRHDGSWRPTGARIPGLIPFNQPKRLANGSLIMSGEYGWHVGAVAISPQGDPLHWEVVQLPIATAIPLRFAEVTVMDRGDHLVAIFRPGTPGPAPTCHSCDGGRTWSPLVHSNLPMTDSKPLCVRLSTGQHVLISNDPVAGRTLLRIAVTTPGGTSFRRMWKLRHQAFPRRRLFGGYGSGPMVGHDTEWSYPAAVEHAGSLYVSYTHGKEDGVLSIIPLHALAAG